MAGESNRAEFAATFDECVDVNLRVLRASPSTRAWRRNATLINIALSGIAAFAVFWLAGLRPKSTAELFGLIGVTLLLGGLGGFFGRGSYDRMIERRTRQLLTEQVPGQGPFPFEIELRPEGVWFRGPQGESSVPWTQVTGVLDAVESVEIRLRFGIIVVRNRGFASPAAREEFMRLAQSRAACTG